MDTYISLTITWRQKLLPDGAPGIFPLETEMSVVLKTFVKVVCVLYVGLFSHPCGTLVFSARKHAPVHAAKSSLSRWTFKSKG